MMIVGIIVFPSVGLKKARVSLRADCVKDLNWPDQEIVFLGEISILAIFRIRRPTSFS